MRILVVTTWLPTPFHPSTGAFVVKDAQAIARLGHDIAIVHLAPPHQLPEGSPHRVRIAGMPVTRVRMSTSHPGHIAAAGLRLQSLARRADAVHTMAFSSLLPMSWWRPGVPWVHTEHWSGLTAPRTLPTTWRLALPGLKRLLARPDVVTAVVDHLARPIRAVRGARPTTVVPCIVPVPEPVPRRREPDGTLALVCVGALVDRKDPLLAVEVVAELRGRGRPTRITFVGDGDLTPAVARRASELGLAEHVRLTGPLNRAGVLAELAAADLFLGPTRGDNFFVSCAEALTSGRPVVVGATGGQGEYIAPHVGRTVEHRSATAYADAVEHVLDSTAGMSAAEISDTVGQRFSIDTVARGYQAAYDLAVSARGRHE